MSKRIITITGGFIVLCFVGYSILQLSKSRTFQLFGELIYRADTSKKVVALTFDDAPSAHTTEILKILKEKNIVATFYVIGQSIEKYPSQTSDIVKDGHELGNHSYSHKRFILKSQSFIQGEIEVTNKLIRTAGYSGEITFRPPNGKKLFGLPWYLSKSNIKTIMWDVEPDTYHPGDTENITKFTLANVKPGSIILIHPFCTDVCLADREALHEIIDALKIDGYSFVTISDMLKYNGKR